MLLTVFQKHQNESDEPFVCINKEHEMTLIPIMNEDRTIKLKCFFPNCEFTMKPGQKTYLKILEKQLYV